MAFRQVRVLEVREVLRLWLRGEGFRKTERLASVDRKTVRRYVHGATELGVVRDGGEGQLTDELIGSVVEAVRPHRSDGHSARRRPRRRRVLAPVLRTDSLHHRNGAARHHGRTLTSSRRSQRR
jgi:hypothetical protein